jgi:UDP:flavonoid glycosyltransferase YjiC (YdhE family)
MEARATRRPIVIVEEVGRQEHGNGALVEQLGLGFHCKTNEQIIMTVRSLLEPKYYADICQRLDSFPTPRGANEAARTLLEELKSTARDSNPLH